MWSESSTSVKQHSVTNFLAFVILTINYSTPTYHPVWLVFLGSIPTCACFHSENFLWLIKLLVLLCNYTKGVSRVLDTYYGRFQFCSNVPYSVSWQLFSPKEGHANYATWITPRFRGYSNTLRESYYCETPWNLECSNTTESTMHHNTIFSHVTQEATHNCCRTTRYL